MTEEIRSTELKAPAKPEFKNRLARSMVVALLGFAVLPVLIMGVAGYFRAQSLLREQVSTQLHILSETQSNALEQEMRTKEIRLDRVGRRPDFLSAAESLHERYSQAALDQMNTEFDAVNRPDGAPIFARKFAVLHTAW